MSEFFSFLLEELGPTGEKMFSNKARRMTHAAHSRTNRSNTSPKAILAALPEVFLNSKGLNDYQFAVQHGLPAF